MRTLMTTAILSFSLVTTAWTSTYNTDEVLERNKNMKIKK